MDLFPAAAMSVLTAAPTLVTGLASVILMVAKVALQFLVLLSSYVVSALSTIMSVFGSTIMWPFSLASGLMFLVLSPVIYTVAYTFAPFWYLVSLVPRLEPLFIFFGSAAFVGVVAGIFVKITSDLLVAALSLDKHHDDRSAREELMRRPSSDSANSSLPSSATATKREEDYFLGGPGQSDIDWQVIDRVTNSEHMRRMPLLQSIILEEEEDDSSVGG